MEGMGYEAVQTMLTEDRIWHLKRLRDQLKRENEEMKKSRKGIKKPKRPRKK
jgi:hypothetical protein